MEKSTETGVGVNVVPVRQQTPRDRVDYHSAFSTTDIMI